MIKYPSPTYKISSHFNSLNLNKLRNWVTKQHWNVARVYSLEFMIRHIFIFTNKERFLLFYLKMMNHGPFKQYKLNVICQPFLGIWWANVCLLLIWVISLRQLLFTIHVQINDIICYWKIIMWIHSIQNEVLIQFTSSDQLLRLWDLWDKSPADNN